MQENKLELFLKRILFLDYFIITIYMLDFKNF